MTLKGLINSIINDFYEGDAPPAVIVMRDEIVRRALFYEDLKDLSFPIQDGPATYLGTRGPRIKSGEPPDRSPVAGDCPGTAAPPDRVPEPSLDGSGTREGAKPAKPPGLSRGVK